MKCQSEFNSLGPMNRICVECNESNSRSAKRVERGGIRGKSATSKGKSATSKGDTVTSKGDTVTSKGDTVQ